MIGYTCKYVPIEIFAGFDESCELLNREAEQFVYAQSRMHPNMCSHVKAVLEELHTGEADQVVLTNCCDSMRRLYDVLDGENLSFRYLLEIPVDDSGCAVLKLQRDFLKLIDDFERFSKKRFNKKKFLEAFSPKNSAPGAPYIALLGARSNRALKSVLQNCFSLPVYDLTCANNRAVSLPDVKDEESIEALMLAYARAILSQTPCMRMRDKGRRAGLLKETGCAGIIYHTVKFCDFYDFEYSELKDSSLPLLKIETDFTKQSYGQLLTRAEGFAERIEKGNREKKMVTYNRNGLYYAGIDSGSTSTELVLLDEKRNVVKKVMVRTGANAGNGAQKAMEAAGVKKADLKYLITTGYGRKNIGFADDNVTEITCHAKGASHLVGGTRTIIDIGGQDSKVIFLDENGKVINFVMNDKCAAGTGRFLENMAKVLEISLDEMASVGLGYKKDLTISSMCTVFAESEVVSLIAENESVADIVHGLNKSIAAKTKTLARNMPEGGPVVMTGGVGNNRGVVAELEKQLEKRVIVPQYPEYCGALGAALIAYETAAINE